MLQRRFQSIRKEWLIINYRDQKGFSVAEAIVAVSIFMLIVSSIIGGLVSSNKWSTFFGSKSRATMIAEEGIEAVRNIQDENFSNLVDGSYGLAVSGSGWNFSGTEDVVDEYTRQVVISSIDSDTKQIVSNVSWEYRGEAKSVSITTYFTNWEETATLPNAVSQWHFDENVDLTVYDSADSNNGTITGAIWTTGVSGSALEFDGTDDKVEVDNSANLSLSAITVEAWIRPRGLNTFGWKIFVCKNNYSNEGWTFLHAYDSHDGGWTWDNYLTTNINGDHVRSTQAVVEDEWQYVAFTYDSTHLNIYYNGSEVYSGEKQYSLSSIEKLVIGSRGVGDNYNGGVDEVSVYDRALTANEILERYNMLKP